jgi:hypothetical protein
VTDFNKEIYKILTLTAKAEIIKKLDKGESLLIWLTSMVLNVQQYTISGKI